MLCQFSGHSSLFVSIDSRNFEALVKSNNILYNRNTPVILLAESRGICDYTVFIVRFNMSLKIPRVYLNSNGNQITVENSGGILASLPL